VALWGGGWDHSNRPMNFRWGGYQPYTRAFYGEWKRMGVNAKKKWGAGNYLLLTASGQRGNI